MRLLEKLEKKAGALKVSEVAEVLGVTPQHIYKMAACGEIPSFRVSGAVRFDPGDIGEWLKKKQLRFVHQLRTASAGS
jgi:excisionase family DNA binding protein